MATKRKPYISPEAYLERERAAEFKSEYYNGEIFAMAGTSRNHAVISSNIGALLHASLRQRGCFILQGDMRVHIPTNGLYTYPDVTIFCGEEKYLEDHFDTLLNPVLLMEILSPSTEQYDRGQKFTFYRSIPSLKEYVLITQERPAIEVFRKNEAGHWVLYEPNEAGTIELASIGCTLTLDDVYEGVEFGEVSLR